LALYTICSAIRLSVGKLGTNITVPPETDPLDDPPDGLPDDSPDETTPPHQTVCATNAKETILIAHWNVRSIMNKRDEIEHFILTNNIDILAISETWLNDYITNAELRIPNYSIVRQDRNRDGGGVMFYCRDSLRSIRVDFTFSNVECVWVKLVVNHQNMIVGCVYRPPSSNVHFLNNFFDVLEQAFDVSEQVIVVGDLNYDCLAPKVSSEITSIESCFNMSQLVKDATRVTLQTKSLIDVVLSNVPELHSETKVMLNNASDHYPVLTKFKVEARCNTHNVVSFRDYKNFNVNNFVHDLSERLGDVYVHLTDSSVLSAVDPEVLWENFKQIFIDVSNLHAPFKTMRLKQNHKPWVTYDIVALMHRRDYVHKLAVRSKNNEDWEEYKRLRNLVTQRIRDAKRNYFHQSFYQNRNDPKKLWKCINKALGKDYHDSPPSDLSANDFNDFFSSIGSKTVAANVNSFNSNSNNTVWKNPPCVYDFNFTYAEIIDIVLLLKKLPSESSCDVLGFDSKLLFLSCDIIAPVITLIVNASLYHSVLPSDWKFSRVTPVFKGKGSKSNCNNYRPISVITHIAKLVERVVQKQLLSYLISHDLINIDQSAYRPMHNTQTALHRVVDEWLENIEEGLLTGVCFLDIRKCFDTIDHNVLLWKMERYGIRGRELEWFKNYLSGRSQVVKHKTLSEAKFLNVGIPQGSVLGPNLFYHL